LNLLTLLRAWVAVERCVQTVIEFSNECFSSIGRHRRSVACTGTVTEVGRESEWARQVDEYCKLLSDYTPPHPSLSSYMAKLLALGLIDASFKWRDQVNSSGQQEDHRDDVWWEGLFSARIDPGGLLGQVGSVLNIAATELAKDESERTNGGTADPTAVSCSPSLTSTEKKRLIGNLWMCVPALVLLIECTALTEPQVSYFHLSLSLSLSQLLDLRPHLTILRSPFGAYRLC
jgi:hypothetical protein